MAEPDMDALIDEHIALLDEARTERDHHKQHAADLGVALSDAQDLNAELVAALNALEKAATEAAEVEAGKRKRSAWGAVSYSGALQQARAAIATLKLGQDND